jgi:hypothetical protein
LSGFPSFISEKIQYDDPKKLEETIRRAKCLYDKKKKGQLSKNLWKTKRNSIWIIGLRELSHHSSEIILRDNQLPDSQCTTR